MNIPDELWLVLFLGIFNVAGGAALGSGARQLVQGQTSALSLLIWGACFGGFPLWIAVNIALSSDLPLLCFVNPALFGSAVLFGMLLLPWLSERINWGAVLFSVIGVALLIAGAGVGIVLLNEGQTAIAARTGGLLALGGALLCALSIASR